MTTPISLEAEQELAEAYLKRWQKRLYLGNWHLHVIVQTSQQFESPNDIHGTFSMIHCKMDTDSKVACIYALFSGDRPHEEEADDHGWWENLEMEILHELYHVVYSEEFPKLPKKMVEAEEKLVNKLTLITYEMFNKADPTKEEQID